MKKTTIIIALILINIAIRTSFSILTLPKGDILVHQDWAKILLRDGLIGSYFSQKWTFTPPTQPPLMMTCFYLSSYIYENRNFFSLIHNTIKIPPAFILLEYEKYGEIMTLRLWETLATYLIALILFIHFFKTTSFKKSILIFSLIIFNPISIFTNSVWGQNDLLPSVFVYLGFLSVFSNYILLAPLFFLTGILFKPTILTLTPLFAYIFIKNFYQHQSRHKILIFFLMFFSCFILLWFSFKPYIPDHSNHLQYISDIVNNRIKTSSKGQNLASVSAFNLYSLIFNIDQTYGTNSNSVIQLKDIGLVIFLIFNFIFIFKLIKTKNTNFNLTLFYIYIISNSAFLFLTNMLERYFIPGFISSVIIMVIYWKKFGFIMVLQQLIWFLNLIYAYYHRDNQFIFSFFKGYHSLSIRLFSLLNLVVFFLFIKTFLSLKTLFQDVKINQNIHHR